MTKIHMKRARFNITDEVGFTLSLLAQGVITSNASTHTERYILGLHSCIKGIRKALVRFY